MSQVVDIIQNENHEMWWIDENGDAIKMPPCISWQVHWDHIEITAFGDPSRIYMQNPQGQLDVKIIVDQVIMIPGNTSPSIKKEPPTLDPNRPVKKIGKEKVAAPPYEEYGTDADPWRVDDDTASA